MEAALFCSLACTVMNRLFIAVSTMAMSCGYIVNTVGSVLD